MQNADIKSAPVAWRWRPKGCVTWTYDPEPQWLARQSDDVIDREPLYAAHLPHSAPVSREEVVPIITEFFWLIEMHELGGGVFYWQGTYNKEHQYWDWSAKAVDAVRFPSKKAAEVALVHLGLNYVYVGRDNVRRDKIAAIEHGFVISVANSLAAHPT